MHLTGLPDDASRYQRKIHKKYGGITKVRRKIEYDLKQGATNNDLMLFLKIVKKDPLFSELRDNEGFDDRVNEIESYFLPINSHLILPAVC